LHMII